MAEAVPAYRDAMGTQVGELLGLPTPRVRRYPASAFFEMCSSSLRHLMYSPASMKVAIYNSLYPPLGIGGAERSIKFLAEALVARGHQVLVVSQGVEWTHVRETVNGVDVVRMGSPPGFTPNIYAHVPLSKKVFGRIFKPLKPERGKFYATEIAKYKADIVHSNAGGDVFSFWQSVDQLGIPIVHTLRNPSLICPRRKFAEGRSCGQQCDRCREQTRKRRSGTKWITGVVGISDFILQEHLLSGYFCDKSIRRVIPNSYAAESTHHVPREPNAPLRIGYLGRLHETKGIEELIVAMRSVRGRAKLIVAGTGNPDYVGHLRSISDNQVEFVGFVRAEEALNQLDVLAVPSLWSEPFGRVYAEAQVHGVPVIGSIYGAGRELVREGKTGWLCDPANPESFKAAIRRCLHDLEKSERSFRQNCLAAAARFSVDAVAAAYEDVYEATIEEHRTIRQCQMRAAQEIGATP